MLIFGPVWGGLSDRFPRLRVALPLAATVATAGATSSICRGLPRRPRRGGRPVHRDRRVSPMLDARTLETLGSSGRNRFGQVRAFGSLSFVVATLIVGVCSTVRASLPVPGLHPDAGPHGRSSRRPSPAVDRPFGQPARGMRRVLSVRGVPCSSVASSSSGPPCPARTRSTRSRWSRSAGAGAQIGLIWAIGARSRCRSCTCPRDSPSGSGPSGCSCSGPSRSRSGPACPRSPRSRGNSWPSPRSRASGPHACSWAGSPSLRPGPGGHGRDRRGHPRRVVLGSPRSWGRRSGARSPPLWDPGLVPHLRAVSVVGAGIIVAAILRSPAGSAPAPVSRSADLRRDRQQPVDEQVLPDQRLDLGDLAEIRRGGSSRAGRGSPRQRHTCPGARASRTGRPADRLHRGVARGVAASQDQPDGVAPVVAPSRCASTMAR